MDGDILPNRTVGSGWSTGGFDSQDPAQFEERHLIFLQQLGKVQTKCGNCAFKSKPTHVNKLRPLFPLAIRLFLVYVVMIF